MAQTKIKLNAVEDATELVQAAEKCDFDIDVANGRAIVDAKSLLGVISVWGLVMFLWFSAMERTRTLIRQFKNLQLHNEIR